MENELLSKHTFLGSVVVIITTEKTSHIDVLFFFFNLFLGGLLSSGSTSSSWASTTGGGSSSSDVGEHITNISTLKSLGEEHGPVRLNGVSGSLDHFLELLSLELSEKRITYSHFNTIIMEHEGGIRAAELVVLSLREGFYINTCHFSYQLFF